MASSQPTPILPSTAFTADMTSLLQASLTPTTRASYSAAAQSFLNFCSMYHYTRPDSFFLLASEHTLMLFYTHLSHS